MKIYEKIRTYLEENNIKQDMVAKKADIPYVIFNSIMNGKRTLYAEEFRAICIALDISPELFIEVKNTTR